MSGESTRRLAAIVMGDIVGYTRMMGSNERDTHVRVQRLFRELIDPTVAEHRGRLIKTSGDGFLAMFDSPVEAVRCAIVIQQSMVGRNLELPEAQSIRFRIGVNLGDVIVEADDIYGEGVNVAARLEQLAEPGNIYISGGVYEQIRYKLVCGYQSLGDRKVKNIVDPVPIYRVLPDPAALARATGGHLRRSILGVGTIIVIGVGIVVGIAVGQGGRYAWNHSTEHPMQPVAAATQAPAQPVTPLATASQAVSSEQPAPAPTTSDAAPPRSVPDTRPGPALADPTPPPNVQGPVLPAQMHAAITPLRLQTGRTDAPGSPDTPGSPDAPGSPNAIEQPEMIFIDHGTFRMGSTENLSEQPVHSVTVGPFLIAKFPVTTRQWRACVAAKSCSYVPSGGDDAPVSNVSWADTQQFIAWLSQATQRRYRLPSEAEWEYAARGGTNTRYWWGNAMKPGLVDCKGCGPHDAAEPAQVGALPANPFGLHDIGGGLAEWVEDCWHKNYGGAPADGSAWLGPDCRERVLRGGSWRNDASYARLASRDYYDASVRYPTHGLRLIRLP